MKCKLHHQDISHVNLDQSLPYHVLCKTCVREISSASENIETTETFFQRANEIQIYFQKHLNNLRNSQFVLATVNQIEEVLKMEFNKKLNQLILSLRYQLNSIFKDKFQRAQYLMNILQNTTHNLNTVQEIEEMVKLIQNGPSYLSSQVYKEVEAEGEVFYRNLMKSINELSKHTYVNDLDDDLDDEDLNPNIPKSFTVKDVRKNRMENLDFTQQQQQKSLHKMSKDFRTINTLEIQLDEILTIDLIDFVKPHIPMKNFTPKLLMNSKRPFSEFADHCKHRSNLLFLFQSNQNKIFGGYCDPKWILCNDHVECNKAFLFSWTHKTIHTIVSGQEEYAYYMATGQGPTWGEGYDLYISLDGKQCNSSLGMTYDDNNIQQPEQHLAGAKKFNIELFEIYQLIQVYE